MSFGDKIDWDKEARRAAAETPPDERLGEMHACIRDAVGGLLKPSLVDCGCNIGLFYPGFAHLGFEYIGIDQSEAALAIARERYPAADWVQSFLWDDWPRMIGCVDVALCNAVLQHNKLDEKHRILPRVAQAVKVGGLFAIQESTVTEETGTQLRHEQWIALVEGHGFKLLKTWHKNELGIEDGYLFRRL